MSIDIGRAAMDALEAAIAERWRATADQVASTAHAIRERRLILANSAEAITERRNRLQRRNLHLEGIVDEDDSVWLSFFSRGLAAARSVGRVVLLAGGGEPVRPAGTGVLVAPALLLTNNHVVWDGERAAAMSVELGYDYDDTGAALPFQACRLEPHRCFWTDEELDFTVVAVADLDGRPPGDKYGVTPLIEPTGKALKTEILNVIHHPGGERKRLSIRENRLVAEDELWLRYASDTSRGSSGAPVFNDQWEMVALHHGGVSVRDAGGAQLSRAGQRWTENVGDEAKAYLANEGARVSRIVRRLRAAALDPPARAMVEQALQAGAGR